jgi:CubicO group peptidase (beta-lactamase class C family)
MTLQQPARGGFMNYKRLAKWLAVIVIAIAWIPGTVTLVARRGHIVHFEALGYRDVDKKSRMATDNIFRLASMTKPITSVALMILWEEGKLRLRNPVSKYLPEFSEVQVSTTGDASDGTGSLEAPRSPMTIRQLLTHTSGLANRYTGNGTFYNEHMRYSGPPPGDTLEKWVKRLAGATTQLPSRHTMAILPCYGRCSTFS